MNRRQLFNMDRESLGFYIVTWLLVGLSYLAANLLVSRWFDPAVIVLGTFLGIFIDRYYHARSQLIKSRIVGGP